MLDDVQFIDGGVSLPVYHGHIQVTDNAPYPLSAPSAHTPAAYCRAASPVLPAVRGHHRIRPR